MKSMNVVQEQPKSRHLMMKAAGASEVSEKREADTVGRKDRTHTVI